jgi:hypothetical protein
VLLVGGDHPLPKVKAGMDQIGNVHRTP